MGFRGPSATSGTVRGRLAGRLTGTILTGSGDTRSPGSSLLWPASWRRSVTTVVATTGSGQTRTLGRRSTTWVTPCQRPTVAAVRRLDVGQAEDFVDLWWPRIEAVAVAPLDRRTMRGREIREAVWSGR